MPRVLKLLIKIGLIACAHAGVLFLAYGKRWLGYLPAPIAAPVWLLLPSCIACYLYYNSFSQAGSFFASNRHGRLWICSVVVTLASLYGGVFLAFNVYGS